MKGNGNKVGGSKLKGTNVTIPGNGGKNPHKAKREVILPVAKGLGKMGMNRSK